MRVPREEDPTEDRFWIFVDLGPEHPEFYIAPGWWVQNDIYEHHRAYLERHGGKRAVNDESQHHAIQTNRLLNWKHRWDVLGVLDEAD